MLSESRNFILEFVTGPPFSKFFFVVGRGSGLEEDLELLQVKKNEALENYSLLAQNYVNWYHLPQSNNVS